MKLPKYTTTILDVLAVMTAVWVAARAVQHFYSGDSVHGGFLMLGLLLLLPRLLRQL